MPVEAWMLVLEGRMIFHELHSHLYPHPYIEYDEDDEDQYPIKFKDTWKHNFTKRHNTSFRTLGTKMNKKAQTPQMIEVIQDFHMPIRSLQLSVINDSKYGLSSPEFVYLHGQVPIKLADSNQKTVKTTGAKENYDGVNNNAEIKRFCTLNLYGPM